MRQQAYRSLCQNGVAFLQRRQLPWGESACFISSDYRLAHGCTLDSAVFVTALVLHALSFVEAPGLAPTLQRALDFLTAEQDERGLWRYWSSRSPKSTPTWCPPDLDDTCSVAWVLRRHGVRL